MGIGWPSRYYLLKAEAASVAGDDGLMHAWYAKHDDKEGRPLPWTYPLDEDLDDKHYWYYEDLLEAEVEDLVSSGFTYKQARDILTQLIGEDMGYTISSTGRWANTESISLVGSAARTVTGVGSALELGDRNTLRLVLAVTAASGTLPTLDCTVQTRKNADDAWRTVGTFTQATTTTSESKCLTGIDREVRLSYVIAGTLPSFTFSLTGEAA